MKKLLNNCPSCNSFRSVYLDRDHIKCSDCSFNYQILCPYCGIGKFKSESNGSLSCQQCGRESNEDTLAYIISNKLSVHESQRCHYCNGPTLFNEQSNIKPRCFEHPNCGNQVDLFQVSSDEEYVFVDLETTGLEIGNESIIEIGACKVDKHGKETFFQEFVKPVKEVSSLITKITGITQSMVQNAPSLKVVLEEFVKFAGSAHIVAHNAQFDVPWLMSSLLRHDLKIQFEKVLCTLNWARGREEGKRSLGALSKKYNIGHANAHRALADAVVTRQLFSIYIQESEESAPFEVIDRYLELSKKIINQHSDFIQA